MRGGEIRGKRRHQLTIPDILPMVDQSSSASLLVTQQSVNDAHRFAVRGSG